MGNSQYQNLEDLADWEFFSTILKDQKADEGTKENEFGFSMGYIETTLNILNNFYSDYDRIMELNDYRDLITNEVIVDESHVIPLTELVIGVLLK